MLCCVVPKPCSPLPFCPRREYITSRCVGVATPLCEAVCAPPCCRLPSYGAVVCYAAKGLVGTCMMVMAEHQTLCMRSVWRYTVSRVWADEAPAWFHAVWNVGHYCGLLPMHAGSAVLPTLIGFVVRYATLLYMHPLLPGDDRSTCARFLPSVHPLLKATVGYLVPACRKLIR